MPKFIQDKPSKENDLWIVYWTLVDTLNDIIKSLSSNNHIRNVIWLFWEWWSWKSSIISQLTDKTEDIYKVFEFNSWSHKNEFLKRAFLIELTHSMWIESEKVNVDYLSNYKWFKLIEILTNNVKRQKLKIENNPEITPFSIILFLILFFAALWFSFKDILFNIISYINFSWLYIPLFWYDKYIFTWSILSILFILFLIRKLFFDLVISIKNYISKELWNIFKYILVNKINLDENKLQSENIDFTNYDYQNLFIFSVVKFLEQNEWKKIIIVLDNLDRVSDDVVLNSISLVQSTIEGFKNENEKYCSNIIFILPIDKDRVKQVFESLLKTDEEKKNKEAFIDWFIDKTFSSTLYIPEIHQTNWKEYFRLRIKEAFSDVSISDKDIELIIFMFFQWANKKEVLTPREMLNFINDLVSNYIFWEKYSNEEKIKDEEKITILEQSSYCMLLRYNNSFIKELHKKIISDLSSNFILKELHWYIDYKRLLVNLLKQKYKINNVYEFLFKNDIEIYLKEWNEKEIIKILDSINKEQSKKDLLKSSIDWIKNTDDFNILWNIIYVLNKLDNSLYSIYIGSLVQVFKNLVNSDNAVIKTLKPKAAEWILYFVNNKIYNKSNLSNKLIDTLIELIPSKND